MSETFEHLAAAIDPSTRIAAHAEAFLGAIDRQIQTPGWRPEFRRIMWEAIARAAKARAKQAAR